MANLIENRYAKAVRLADFIEARRVQSQVRTYSESEWAEMAAEAAEEAPSAETVALALSILAGRARDPFDGLDAKWTGP